MTDPPTGVLSIVATPIGNFEDLSPRARDCLHRADLIAAEDTRVALTLLKQAGIDNARLLSYFDHNEQQRTRLLLDKLAAGMHIALISDAGTPLVSDPGFRIVTAAIAAGVRIEALPGPTAAIAALTVSGLPCDRFLFCGFGPKTPSARRSLLQEISTVDATLLFYEGPHRLLDLLADMQTILGDRQAALARNLTKETEHVLRGPLSSIAEQLAEQSRIWGEMTLVVDRPAAIVTASAEQIDRAIVQLLQLNLPPRKVRDLVCDIFEAKKRDVYQRVLELDRGEE